LWWDEDCCCEEGEVAFDEMSEEVFVPLNNALLVVVDTSLSEEEDDAMSCLVDAPLPISVIRGEMFENNGCCSRITLVGRPVAAAAACTRLRDDVALSAQRMNLGGCSLTRLPLEIRENLFVECERMWDTAGGRGVRV